MGMAGEIKRRLKRFFERDQFSRDLEEEIHFHLELRSQQQVIKSINPNVCITHVTTLDEQLARSMTNQRSVAQLSAFFGALAVFLSSIGIYGLMSYVVSRRTNEIGIRMALGAARSNVSWLIARDILILVVAGIGIGIPTALAGNHLAANMLYGLKGTDPLSLAAAVVVLLLVASIAGYFPAKRAARIDPMEALRYEYRLSSACMARCSSISSLRRSSSRRCEAQLPRRAKNLLTGFITDPPLSPRRSGR